jgi:hypothetical protein
VARYALTWLAQTLRVLSRRMTSRILPDSGLRILASPVPRSFHSDEAFSKRKSLARLEGRRGRTRDSTTTRTSGCQRGSHVAVI